MEEAKDANPGVKGSSVLVWHGGSLLPVIQHNYPACLRSGTRAIVGDDGSRHYLFRKKDRHLGVADRLTPKEGERERGGREREDGRAGGHGQPSVRIFGILVNSRVVHRLDVPRGLAPT